MSMLESLASTLTDMGFVQLSLLFLAVGAYSLAINSALGSGLRGGAASTAFVASVGFATLTPSWMSGVVFLALAVLAVAAFAGAVWALSLLLGLASEHGTPVLVFEEERAPARAPVPQPVAGFAPSAIRSPS
jgi:hypothetical protein